MKSVVTFGCMGLVVFFIFGVPEKRVERQDVLLPQEWLGVYENFQPDPAQLVFLKSRVGGDLRIDVYFGFWCGDSLNHVPRFIKILDGLGDQAVEVSYYEFGRKENKEQKYYFADTRIERLPAFVFYRQGQEIGRIVENPKKDLLEDFIEIVF